MSTNTPRIRSLLRQANRTESAGKRAAAEELYRKVLSESPETIDAWLGVARVIKNPDEIKGAYRQVLLLEPQNIEASAGLAVMRGEKPPKEPELEEYVPAAEEIEIGPQADGDSPDTSQADGFDPATIELAPQTEIDLEPDTQKNGKELVSEHIHQAEASSEVLYCANHPSRETHLRCNRCGKPICTSCAQSTPVGYRCPECIREHEDIFYTATAIDYIVAAVIAVPFGLIAGNLVWFITSISFFGLIIIVFLAPTIGTLLGRIIMKVLGRRRGRWLPHLAASAIIIGAGLPLITSLLSVQLFGVIILGIYIVAASGAAYYQMR